MGILRFRGGGNFEIYLDLCDRKTKAPWLVIRDFNEILSHNEKSEGCMKVEQLEDFREALLDCGLDLDFSETPFT